MKRILSAIVLMVSVFGAIAQESAVELKNAGNAKLKAKDYAGALTLFEKYAAADAEAYAEDNSTNYNMGYAAYKSKSYEKGVKYFSTSIAKGYKAEKAYLYSATCKAKLGDKEGYLSTLEEGIEKYPNSTSLKKTYSNHYVKLGNAQYKKAAGIVATANKNVAAKKYDTASDTYKAEMAKAKKEFATSIPHFDKALELYPANANATKLKNAATTTMNAL